MAGYKTFEEATGIAPRASDPYSNEPLRRIGIILAMQTAGCLRPPHAKETLRSTSAIFHLRLLSN